MANRRFIDFPIASTVGDNDIVLIWQDGINKQTTKGTLIQGAPTSLEGLTDVDIAGLINGQILQYNSTTGKWENVDRTDINLSELNDVSIVSPANGQVLVYNSSTSKWENSSGGYVPYVGAVTTVDLGTQGLIGGYIRFNTSVVSVPNEQGLMYWEDSKSTVALIMNGTTQHIGQDTYFYVKNSTGSNIAKGVAVRFDGTDGASGHLLIAPFLADGTYPSAYFMGVTAEAIDNGDFGQVTNFGEIEGIDTSIYSAGDLLYASTTSAGAFQTTAPVAPNNIVLIAAAINSKNNGAIIVRPTYGSNINNDEGVKIVSPTTGDLLQLQAGGLWENKTKAQILGGTSSQFVKGDGSLDSTSYQPLLTNPVTGTGTTNYLPKFTGSTTIGNSVIADNTNEINIPKRIFLNSGTESIFFTPNLGGTSNRIEGSSGVPLEITTGGSSLKFAAGGTTPQFTLASSGAATFTGSVTASSIIKSGGTSTQYLMADGSVSTLTNPVTGTGSAGQVAYWSSGSAITGESNLFWDATNDRLGISTNTPAYKLDIQSTIDASFLQLTSTATANNTSLRIGIDGDNSFINASGGSTGILQLRTYGSTKATLTSGGNLLVGTTTDAGYKLDVNGTGRFSGALTGTTATFGSTGTGNNVIAISNNDQSNVRLRITNTGSGGRTYSLVGGLNAANNSSFSIFDETAGSTRFEINSTGAATFSSSVTANGLNALGSTLNNGNAIRFYRAGLVEMAYIGWSNENTNNSTWLFKSSNGNPIGFIADGTTQALTLTTTNNLLVGTTTDSGYKLDVNGTFRSSSGEFINGGQDGSLGSVVRISTTNTFVGSRNWAIVNTWDNYGDLTFRVSNAQGGNALSAGATRMVLLANGNVGIGTSSPSTALHVVSNDNSANRTSPYNVATITATSANAPYNGFGTGLVFAATHYNGLVYNGARIRNVLNDNSIVSLGNSIAFDVTATRGGTLTEAMKIDYNGNVGIGTSSPGYRLVVNSATDGISAGISGNTYGIRFDNGGTFSSGMSTIHGVDNTLIESYQPIMLNGLDVRFGTSATERMRITSGGNVGIGDTDPDSKLKVTSSTNSSWATQIINIGSTNAHGLLVYTGASSTGIPFIVYSQATERMRITSGGNVLIGTTTDNGAKLQVNGRIYSDGGDGKGILINANGSSLTIPTTGLSFQTGFNVSYINSYNSSSSFNGLYIGSSLLNVSSLGTGTVYSNGGTLTNTNPSDLNLKTNVESINYGLEEILKLNPVSFHWKNDTINQGKQYGFIAQEVQKIMPDLVKQGEYLGLDKEAIFTTLVKAIQELNEKIK